jgi:hypothetical protein
MRKPIAPAVLDLLLLTKSLIDQTTGNKKAALQSAWIRTFNSEAAQMLDLDVGRLPTNPRNAVRALVRECLQLAKAEGMDGVELSSFFNDNADRGALIEAPDPDQAIRRCFALLSILAARREAIEPPQQQETA